MTKQSQSKPKTRSDSSKTSFSSMHRGLSWQRSFSNDGSVQRKPEETPEYSAPGADFDLTGVSSYPQSPAGVQAKLTVGEPGDKYEQEADSVAAEVVNQINSPEFQQQGQAVQRQELSQEDEEEKISPQLESGAIQRLEIPQEDEEEKISPKLMVQRQSGEDGMAATSDVEASINQARGGGQPLADNIRNPMEQAFGADFSGVKVHTDAQSDQLNRSIQARAFATGQDVFFRQGEYNPGSRDGQELIAHELTHVVQQNGADVQGFRSQSEHQQVKPINSLFNAKVAQARSLPHLALQHPAIKTRSANAKHEITMLQCQQESSNKEISRINGYFIQKFVDVKADNKTGLLKAKGDGKRPPGPLLKGEQGDHMTAYVTFEHQIINAIIDSDIPTAWENLVQTHLVIQSLPGYLDSPKWLTNQSDSLLTKNSSVVDLKLVKKDHIKNYANTLLTIRNRLLYTSLPTKGGSTGGQNEAGWAGGLQYLEQNIRNGNDLGCTEDNVMLNMWMTFDNSRFKDVKDQTEQQKILEQHVVSIMDSYPLTVDHFGIDQQKLLAKYN